MKNELLQSFISDKEIINEIFSNNVDVVNYIRKDNKWYEPEKIIEEIIIESFFDDINWKNIDEIINQIQEYNDYQYIDGLIDIYTDDLINSLYYFWTDFEITEECKTLDDVIRKNQFNWYNELFEDIKNWFIEFIENKKNKNALKKSK